MASSNADFHFFDVPAPSSKSPGGSQSHTRSRYGPSTGAPGGGPGGDRGLGAGQSAGTDRDRGPGPQPQAGAEDRGPSHRLGSTRTESQGLPHPHCC